MYVAVNMTGLAKMGLSIINIEKSSFEILNAVYFENASTQFSINLHAVMQDNSIGVLFYSLLAEFPTSFPLVPQVIA